MAKVGKRQLEKIKCQNMDWNNKKEISNWEIAWCLNQYGMGLKLVSARRQSGVNKELDKMKKQSKKDSLDEYIQKLSYKYVDVYIEKAKTFDQIHKLEELLESKRIPHSMLIMLEGLGDDGRNTKRYKEDERSYFNHLESAMNIFKKYEINSKREYNEDNAIQYFMDLILYIGFPRPYTATEIKKYFGKDQFEYELTQVGFSKTSSQILSKQLMDYHGLSKL